MDQLCQAAVAAGQNCTVTMSTGPVQDNSAVLIAAFVVVGVVILGIAVSQLLNRF